jgi:YYY domain-containing protein
MTDKTISIIDLNTVEEAVLVKKLKISRRLASRIIALRPYYSLDQLKEIWGINPEVLDRILPFIRVPQQIIIPDLSKEKESDLSGINNVPEEGEPKLISISTEQKNKSPSFLPDPSISQHSANRGEKFSWKVIMGLALILIIGAFFRFTGLNWDQGQHQHPDERYISMVAEQIRPVSGIATYFDTANSTLNPLRFGSYAYGMFPLFLTRFVADWTGFTTYDAITLVGRVLSGFFDLLAVYMLFLLGNRLYNQRIGLLAATLGAAAVLPIQLSHYFAVDSFSTVFIIAGFYFSIQAIPIHLPGTRISKSNLMYFVLFGLSVGLAGACKVNTLPVFGIIILAGIVRILTNWKKSAFGSDIGIIISGWFLAILAAFMAFRVFQPYAFSGPGFLGISLNEDWLKVMREVINQVAGNSDWPPNTHWTNRPITYSLTNMVVWGLGLPLGLSGWLGWAWVAKRIWNGDWRRHILPFVWVTGYFVWQNIQFWRYMRYFLPIYPFIILFAAWAMVEIYDRTRESRINLLSKGFKEIFQFTNLRSNWIGVTGLFIVGITLFGTFGYAIAFTQIYIRPMTRIVASEWMLENFSAPLDVVVESPLGIHFYPVSVGNHQVVEPGTPGSAVIRLLENGTTSKITTTDVRKVGVEFYFRLTRDEEGSDVITEGRLAILDDDQNENLEISFGDITLDQGKPYYFLYRIQSSNQFSISNITLKNVDENLPSISFDSNLQSQPGKLQDKQQLIPQRPLTLNRLEIKGFKQVFVQSEINIKVSVFNENDTNTPIRESSQTLVFSEPGLRLAPVFSFSPIELIAGQNYQVRYEFSTGAPLHFFGESFTLETSWDDALPLNINKYDVQGGIFTPLNLELYEPDTPEKRESMLRILDESNYIVIPSNRAFDAMPRLPFRYPLTLQYYQALFNCDCSGDALENRAYGLEPPFKSSLGFDLIATFERPPSLGFLVFPDQSADESFTVYDHPRVMVFKKSQDFSMIKVKELLDKVDLNQVLFQTPLQYTQAPTAMRLPPDRLLAQLNSDDWSSVFDRFSILNSIEFVSCLTFYLLFFVLGLIALPYFFPVFSWLPDRGYPLLRIGGLIVTTWLVWFVGSLKILPFSQATIWLVIAICLLLGVGLAFLQRKSISNYLSSNWKHIVIIEAIYLLLFLISLSIRLGNPDLWNPWAGGEKPMDFTFFNAVLRSVYFPPENPWFAGHYLNYYYYGYVLAAIPTKFLGILPSIAYNLVLPSWFAMTGIGIFSIGYNLLVGFRQYSNQINIKPEEKQIPTRLHIFNRQRMINNLPYLAGTFTLVSVLFLGNLDEIRILWKYLPEASITKSNSSIPLERTGEFIGGAIKVLTGRSPLPGNNSRWYFEASRPILTEGPDTPIAEFPYFTFLYGDMHPHMLSMPVYALAFGWLLNIMLMPISTKKWPSKIQGLILAGLIFGSFRATHTWDFPLFIGLGMLVILWESWHARSGLVKQTIQKIIIYELAFLGISIAFYLPFTQWFKTEYVSLQLWEGRRTPVIDYLFVFGLPLFILTSLLVRDLLPIIRTGYQKWVSSIKLRLLNIVSWRYLQWYIAILLVSLVLGFLWHYDYQVLTFGIPFLISIIYLIAFKREIPLLQKITCILFGLGLSITLFVEVFVLSGDVGRSNTVFRFYNQAWFIFGMATSLALIDLFTGPKPWSLFKKSAWGFMLGLLVLFAASYPLIATAKRISDRWPDIQNPPHSLDGALFMLGDASSANPAFYNDDNRLFDLSHDYAAILYMQDHISGSPVIVEGHTGEYRWGSRFSIYTGLPSVIGWSWHVRQHNSLIDGAYIDKLIGNVNNFYDTSDIQEAIKFIERFQVQYIVVGDLERAYYDSNGLSKFQRMVNEGLIKIVYGDNSPNATTIFRVEELINVRLEN